MSAQLLWAEVEFPGSEPGIAEAQVSEGDMSLNNSLFSFRVCKTGEGSLRFAGMSDRRKGALLEGGSELFTLRFANGKELASGAMKADCKVEDLPAVPNALKASEKLPGKALTATFTAKGAGVKVTWRAELRDGSHYIRQRFTVKALQDMPFAAVVPMQYSLAPNGRASVSGNTTHGTLVVNDKLFMGLETPMSLMSVGSVSGAAGSWTPESWSPDAFHDVFGEDVPEAMVKKYGEWCRESAGPVAKYVKMAGGEVNFARKGRCEVTFRYTGGNHKLNMIGVSLQSPEGKLLSLDAHAGHAGDKLEDNVYVVEVPAPGKYTLQYWAECRSETITSKGSIALSLPLSHSGSAAAPENRVQGAWVRKTTLAKGKSWQVSSVIGLLEPGQQRRSFLAYSEREKPVPYRTFVHYNDWYEVGIRINNNADPLKRHSEKRLMDILRHWERELYKKRKVRVDAFVIDDGWDDFNSLWEFHAGFPNGFAAASRTAHKMKAGIGAWLGPVGGYGAAKRMRLEYWNTKHPGNRISNFELSNAEYFEAFVGRCRDMIKKYDMCYFKFDGISTKFHANGPAGLEDAEGIINVVSALRRAKPDVFINATVGTWASPFWFHFVDSIWRQENDFDRVGNKGDARDRWITYRDRLVHEVFVKGAPFCPINSIMTHGIIITKGQRGVNIPPAVMSTEPANCIKEMRAAFGSGSGLQEIYADSDLLDQENGRLWDELAACIAWIRRHEDVLADVHWVGGSPWNGSDGDVYGWAAWNKTKCTLTLRNSSDSPKSLRTTLRELFEVPRGLKGSIRLNPSFADQRALPELSRPVDIDREIDLTLLPFEVLVMEGLNEWRR